MIHELSSAEWIESREEWESLLDASKTVYSTWEWGSVCEAFGHERRYLGVREDGAVVAGIPLMYVDSRLFGRELVSMPYAPYGEVLVADDLADPDRYRNRLLADVREVADSLGVSHAAVRGCDLDSGVEGFGRSSRFVTFETDISDGEDEAWDSVSSRFRRGVRKARKEDLVVERGFDEAALAEYYRMYLDNMRHYGTPPYSRGFFRDVAEQLGRHDAFEMYLAYDPEGRAINGITTFTFGDRTIYWTGVSDYEHRDLNGGSLLLWEAITDSCERGVSTFDLGRTREGTGVYDYKKGIGDPVDLVDIHYAPDGDPDPPDPEAETYEKYKQVWRKLPLRATEILGPHVRKRLSL